MKPSNVVCIAKVDIRWMPEAVISVSARNPQSQNLAQMPCAIFTASMASRETLQVVSVVSVLSQSRSKHFPSVQKSMQSAARCPVTMASSVMKPDAQLASATNQ